MGKRVQELAERLDERGDSVGYTVETTGLSVEKTAKKNSIVQRGHGPDVKSSLMFLELRVEWKSCRSFVIRFD